MISTTILTQGVTFLTNRKALLTDPALIPQLPYYANMCGYLWEYSGPHLSLFLIAAQKINQPLHKANKLHWPLHLNSGRRVEKQSADFSCHCFCSTFFLTCRYLHAIKRCLQGGVWKYVLILKTQACCYSSNRHHGLLPYALLDVFGLKLPQSIMGHSDNLA